MLDRTALNQRTLNLDLAWPGVESTSRRVDKDLSSDCPHFTLRQQERVQGWVHELRYVSVIETDNGDVLRNAFSEFT